MSDLFPVSGARLYIGGVKATQTADFTASDFAAESWTEVDGWEQCGAFGDTANLITTALINRGRDVKQKGTANAGQMQNVFAYVQGDSGQSAMKAARDASDNYAFRILWDDQPSGGSNPTTHYFVGLVMTWQNAGGGANTVRNINATIEINSNVVEVPAS
jgi:hypothetical protein